MCGIAGHVGPRALPDEALRRCFRLMEHRGPDGSGHRGWRTPDGRHVDLLHTRLTIIDLDPRSNQPFAYGATHVTYNGELYNYLELRDELARRGASFRTESDTEVLAALLERDGWDALDRCEGMWAFAAFDEGTGVLTLCRDRFGEKPLYLLRDGADLYFGSEAKFVASLLGRPLRPNVDHLVRYLVNGYKSLYKTGAGFYEGLEELEPGSVLLIDADGSETRRPYWSRVPAAPVDDMSYDEAVAGVRSRLIRSVELRLRADVPLAFCMSGGVDSLSLISIARNVLGHDVHGFTIANSDARYEEQELVDHAVAALGIRHESIPLRTDGFLDRLRTLVRHHDAPLYTITYYVHWLLQESIARNGYRISISGTAADELFTGYFDHHLAYLYELRDDPGHAAARDAWLAHIAPTVRNPYLRNPDLFVERPEERGHVYLNAELFEEYLVRPWHEPFAEHRYVPGLLRNRMLNELFHEAVPVILHEDDLNAMYYSVENRSPFLDRSLYDFATSIPTRHLVRDAYAKAVLRDAMRGIVPDRILDNRRKVGFNAPIFDLLDVADPAVRGTLLAESPVFEIVRRDRIEELLARDFLPNSESKFLFNFLNAKLFLEANPL